MASTRLVKLFRTLIKTEKEVAESAMASECSFRIAEAKDAFEDEVARLAASAKSRSTETALADVVLNGLTTWLSSGFAEGSFKPGSSALTPERLDNTACLAALTSTVDALKAFPDTDTGLRRPFFKGGAVLAAALMGLLGGTSDRFADMPSNLLAVVSWLSEVFTKRWGIVDVYQLALQSESALENGKLFLSPLSVAVSRGNDALVAFLLAKGAPANGTSHPLEEAPLFTAFDHLHVKVFKELVKGGAVLEREYVLRDDDTKSAVASMMLDIQGSTGEKAAAQVEMLTYLLESQPDLLSFTWVGADGTVGDALHTAITSQSAPMVDYVLSKGFKLRYDMISKTERGQMRNHFPSLYPAIHFPDRAVLELLINKYGILHNWKSNYTTQAKKAIAMTLGRLAASSYPVSPGFVGPLRMLQLRPLARENLECVKLVLQGGWNWPWIEQDAHCLHYFLMLMGHGSLLLSPSDTLSVYRMFKDSGMEVGLLTKPSARVPLPTNLAHMAAQHNHQEIFRFAIEECGLDKNGFADHLLPDGFRAVGLLFVLPCRLSRKSSSRGSSRSLSHR
jgi:hypothetical protein